MNQWYLLFITDDRIRIRILIQEAQNMWIWQIRSGSATLLITSIHKPDYCFGLRIFAHDGDFLALCNNIHMAQDQLLKLAIFCDKK
jgi:hypothetical protein